MMIRIFLFIAIVALDFVAVAPAAANRLLLEVEPGYGSVLQGTKHTIPVKIGLTGFELEKRKRRTPINVAIVLDRSGSMAGEKLSQAKTAAINALNMLNGDDIVSIITYDNLIEVIVPATKLSDRQAVSQAIQKITARGNTALFAGVSRGAAELRKFLNENQMNRVILLSDGLANIGPKTPGELGQLGASLAKDGMSISTIGLGLDYNEELLTRLAGMSDGNHAFVENPQDLARILKTEFGDIVNVVAKDLEITITCRKGIRPVRVLGRDADIHGQKVTASIGQVLSSAERYLVLEVELSPELRGTTQEIASVTVSYNNLQTEIKEQVTKELRIGFTNSKAMVDQSLNRSAMAAYSRQTANERSLRAIRLGDAGRKAEARELMLKNARALQIDANKLGDDSLRDESKLYESQAIGIDKNSWSRQRKDIYQQQYSIPRQISPRRYK